MNNLLDQSGYGLGHGQEWPRIKFPSGVMPHYFSLTLPVGALMLGVICTTLRRTPVPALGVLDAQVPARSAVGHAAVNLPSVTRGANEEELLAASATVLAQALHQAAAGRITCVDALRAAEWVRVLLL